MSTATAHSPPSFPQRAKPALGPEAPEMLRQALEHAAHYLPAQAPLEVFVHHNTLHAFQHLPFHQAIAEARKKLHVRGYMSKETYRELMAQGRIRDDDFDAVLADERFPTEPIAPGFPGADVAARLVIRHGVGAETLAHLRWNLVEKDAANRFDADIRQAPRDAIVRATEGWFEQEIAAAGGPAGARQVAAKVVSPTPGAHSLDPLLKLGALLGRRVDPRDMMAAFACNPELFSVRALWTACVRACEHLEGRPCPTEAPARFHRDLLLRTSGEDPSELVHSYMIPLCGAFLDRGQSRWPMPDRDRGFFRAWSKVTTSGAGIRPAWLSGLGVRLLEWRDRQLDSEQILLEVLAELGVEAHELGAYIEETLLLLPGWGGMFHRLESAPSPSGRTRAQVRLVDFLAVRVVLDLFAFSDVAARRLGIEGEAPALRAACASRPQISGPKQRGRHDTAWPLFRLCQLAGVSAATVYAAARGDIEAVLGFLDDLDELTRLRVLHEAYERRYRVELLDALAVNLATPRPQAPPVRHQVVLCFDDRFESSRRHLEEIAPDCETFGAAGFFGLAIAYQGIDDPSTFPLCPVVVKPQHRIEEHALTRQFSIAELRANRRRQLGVIESAWSRASGSLVLGPFVTAIGGFFAAIPLLASVFSPRAAGRIRKAVARWWLPEPMTQLTALRAEDDSKNAEAMSGFTLDEMAARVGSLLENIGLVSRFGQLVVVLGHDSSSVNNPYFPAYSCGACGGRSGGPNARLFARMANLPGVRERLAQRGIVVPEDTTFIGGLYDTASDVIRVFDTAQLPEAAQAELRALTPKLEEMRRRNAHERCRRFEAAPRRLTGEQAEHHVEARAYDLAQARPELGHATIASGFVGRRGLTEGLFLDRRTFLISYDPTIDPEGKILERILIAAAPVGAGINLEYFFSAVDGEGLGSGTKLPHNVTGLFGLMNGASSDLRTGLPKQMIEIHEPIRLQLVVETSPEVLLAIADRQPSVAELVTNEWLRLCSVDPNTRAIQVFDARFGFRPYTPTTSGLPRVHRSRDWYEGRDNFVPPALIRPTS